MLKNEKKKKKRNAKVIDREGDEDGYVKTKENWFENKKKMEQRWTKKLVKTKMIKEFWKLLLKQSKKENLWLLTINCSTNYANLLVIVASHGSLVITNPWLQESIQSMAHKIVLLQSNNTSIPHNKLQVTIKSSKQVRGEHEIKKT